MKMLMTTVLMALIALCSLHATPAMGAPSEQELKKKFEERYPAIRELKQKGVVGETDQGYLDFVKSGDKDQDAAKLVKDENADRELLYVLIAAKEKVDPEIVAKRAAKRNFDRARDGEYLKEDGKWKKKGESSQ